MWHPRTKTLLLCATLLALYNDWFLEPLLNSHLSARYSLISELSAQTQAYHWVFQTLDILAGIGIIAMLPWLWQFLHKSTFHYPLLLFVTVACIGADNIVDALLPISCAPSVETQCSLLATHSILTQAHLLESTLIGGVIFVAPLLWWLSCRNKHTLIARASLCFVMIQVAVGGGILLTRAVDVNVIGLFQRVYVLSIGMWVAGILYIALNATSKQRIPVPSLQPASDRAPTPTMALSYDE
jgi:hypothetical protein